MPSLKYINSPFFLIKRGAKIKAFYYYFFLNKKVIKKSRLRVLPDNAAFIPLKYLRPH